MMIMRKNYIYLFVAAASLLAISCQKKEADTYQPAEPVSGAQYYFSNPATKPYEIGPDVTGIDIVIKRVAADAAGTAKVEVTDTSKTVFAEGIGNLTAAFAEKETESKVTLPINIDNFSYNDLFGLDLKITEETTPYGASSLHIEINYPEPWVSLGTGKYIDKYWGWTQELSVEIMQNDLNKNQFKVLNPYKGAPQCTTNSYITLGGEPEDELNLYLLEKGSTFAGVEITQEGLVYFDYMLVGYFYNDGSNSGNMEIDHPAAFSSLRSEDKWLYNKVLSYQENGLPAQIQLAPYYYIDGLGGFNRITYDDMITITFPGVVVADRTVELTYKGVLKDAEGAESAVVDLAYVGPDAKDVDLVVIPAADEADAIAKIEAGEVEPLVASAAGTYNVPIAEGSAPGKYVVVAVPLDDEGAFDTKKVVSAAFVYGNLTPLQLEYTGDDFVDGISKEKLFSTNWTVYATDDEHSPVERKAYTKVSFEEAEDIAEDSDRILTHGFSYGGAAYYGFTETLYMEYYNGVVYTLGSAESVGTAYGYPVYPTYVTADGSVASYGDDYLMAAAYVADGLLAFVSADEDNNFTQICFGAWDGEDYAGWFTCMNYVLLADPAIYPDPLSAGVALRKAKLGKTVNRPAVSLKPGVKAGQIESRLLK